tara:strand:+ start:3446 stop:5614 length:2169 start_codon:yes stop_codon:yes gene_type:complete
MAIMGLVEVRSASMLEAEQQAANAAQQNSPVIQGLAAHVRKRWASAYTAKMIPEQRLLQCLRQRNGEYDPDKLAQIKEQGGSQIFMMLTSTKCRGAASWLRDTLLGSGTDKPWTLDTTPIADLPPEVLQQAKQVLMQAVQMIIQQTGQQPTPEVMRTELSRMRDEAMRTLQDEAKKRVDRMELKMEDQLAEGRFTDSFSEFIDDIVTFPTAIMKGPVPRKRKTLEWQGAGLVPVEKIVLEWERVDPFMSYPAPWASSPHDGYFIERHRLTREDVENMLDVPGFSNDALNSVLADFTAGGLADTLAIDQEMATAVGKNNAETGRSDDVIDALQLWDSVTGKLLVEWGMSADDVPDPLKSYPCELWLIGSTVIKAVLNYDPLARKPYYTASYERVPGAFWGNGVADLIRDCQAMCNAAARALSNNMGISSGPQVGVNISRIPAGEKITQMYPWKIWQFQNSDYQDAQAPISFFQPPSNANELMAVFEKFQTLADEYSGIPRYMTGENTPGAGRTASGLSMMISNASKSIKSVISAIDKGVISPLLQRLYQHNLRYAQDPDLIGDVNIVAKGAMSLVAKESAAVRRNELLQLVLTNPIAQQICGIPGTAELLRENAKLLDINVDKIIPSAEKIVAQQQEAAKQQAAMQQAALQPSQETVEFQKDETGAVIGAVKRKFVNPALGNGSSFPLPNPPAPKGPPTQPDGTPQGGRQHNLMANVATGMTG